MRRVAWLVAALSLPLAVGAPATARIQAAPLDAAMRDLASPDAGARVAAACALPPHGSKAAPALGGLVALLADDSPVDPRVCRESGSWSWRSGEPTSPGREAALTLAHIGSRAFAPLLAALDDARWVARRHAALGLGALDDRRAGPPLERLLPREPEWQVRRQVAWALGALDDTDAVEALGAALDDEVADVREQVAWALGAIGDRRAVEALAARLPRETDGSASEQMAWALGALDDPRGVAALMKALGSPHANTREQAAWALGAIGDPAATPALVNALKDPSPDVREQAAWALGAIGK